jgi:FkbM family methyltransferase
MRLRDNTQDILTFCQVYWDNEYGLPDSLAGKTVIDVGANVGAFALLCLQRQAKQVWCFEPDPENFALLQENVAHYLGCSVWHAAVWRSDKPEDTVRFARTGVDSACGRVYVEGETEVRAAALDAILRKAGQVDYLKVDAEGSEYPILYTSKELARVQNIMVETHAVTILEGCPRKQDVGGMVAFLREQGFQVEYLENSNGIGCNHLVWGAR